MGTIQTLRPNANVAGGGAWNPGGTGPPPNVWTALSDTLNGTYAQSTKTGQSITEALTSYTVPAGKRLKGFRVGMILTTNSSGSPKVKATAVINGQPISVTVTQLSLVNATKYSPWLYPINVDQSDIDNAVAQLIDQSGSAGNQQIKELFVELDIIDQPVVTVTAPVEASTITSGRPTIVWDYTDGDNDPQALAQILVIPSAVYTAGGFDVDAAMNDFWNYSDSLLALGGWGYQVAGSDSSFTPTAALDIPLLAPGTYRAYVRASHAGGALQYFSAVDSNTFTVSYVTPPTPTVTVGTANSNGPLLTVNGAAWAAGLSTGIVRMQRSNDGGSTWQDLPSGYAAPANFGVAWNVTYRDREAEPGLATKYRAQVLAWDSTNGVWVTGQWSPVVTATLALTDTATQDWTFWSWVRTGTVTVTQSGVEGYTYDTGTWRQFDVLVADEPSEWSETPPQELVATPLGRTKAVVVSSPLAGDEGSVSFLVDNSDVTVNTLTELRDLLKSENVLRRFPGLPTIWLHWTGGRDWSHIAEVREASVGYIETEPPVVTEA